MFLCCTGKPFKINYGSYKIVMTNLSLFLITKVLRVTGQTALHVAIERRSFEHVKLLVQKGAGVQAKANGKFFQRHAEMGFYSGG